MNALQSPLKARVLAKAAIVFAMAVVAHGALAAGPLDFGYAVDGPPTVRPTLVFNDGQDTYIQPASGIPTTVKGAVQDGPYLRVSGMPSAISVRAGRYSMTATHTAPPAPAVESSPYQQTTLQAGGMYQRPEMGGVPPHHQDAPAMPPMLGRADAPTAVAGTLAPTIVGQGAPGLVQGPVVSASIAPSVAESVERAANRIASADSTAANTAAPTSAAATANATATITASVPAAAPQPVSQLASKFGATAIRDSDASHTQIRFAQKPLSELAFTSADGRALNPSWDLGNHVVTIDRVDHFTVTDGKAIVEVARVASSTFDFEVNNPVQLEAVFAKDGATYFKFAPHAKHVRVVDATRTAKGEQKGRYYKVADVGDQFVITAGGKSVTVNRKEAVAYYDRPGKQS
ncbi:hypothetical protein [Paraburkholderia youngii]|uniref:hypothetical protein n=1 Tax=Paraburkholderia youngii TaxID=2782701 RepID=UPI003D19890E